LRIWKQKLMPTFLAFSILCGCAQVETIPEAAVAAGPSVPASNSAPLIGGQPPAATAPGSGYLFQPIASDADGDALTFSIRNKPRWAAFNLSSGMLTGVPAASDIGIFANIVISVSDGVAVTTLSAFSITVGTGTASPGTASPVPAPGPPSAGTGSATLSWTAPTQNTDGSNLTDLAGFRVYSGSNPRALILQYLVTDPLATQFKVDGLLSGTWYFAISAYSMQGVESSLSNIASKVIP
jgi:hypothetical protein